MLRSVKTMTVNPVIDRNQSVKIEQVMEGIERIVLRSGKSLTYGGDQVWHADGDVLIPNVLHACYYFFDGDSMFVVGKEANETLDG